jgi:membrane-associated HD superfamily phosphohydrolase
MSALIIKNHVSDGVAKAEVEKMPHQIIDAISQHHGNSIIAYFYNKAKKKAGQKVISTDDINQILREEGIEENTYRHQGEKPKTVENAIIMIADSCEAASRSMKKITKHGIETLVDVIVNAKMTDGQFDECPITVKQISIIKKNVVQTLLNINHTRVDYKQD